MIIQNNQEVFSRRLEHAMNIASDGDIFYLLSKNLYKNPIRAIIRELVSNAVDACVRANNKTDPIVLHFPNAGEPFFVQDFGIGMSMLTVAKVYSVFLKSDKRTSTKEIGGRGLGAKTPFAYTESFTLETTSPDDGIRRTFVFQRGNVDTPASFSYLDHLDVVDSPIRGSKVSFNMLPEDVPSFFDELHDVFFHNHPIKIEMGDEDCTEKALYNAWSLETSQLTSLVNHLQTNGSLITPKTLLKHHKGTISPKIHLDNHYHINIRSVGLLYQYDLTPYISSLSEQEQQTLDEKIKSIILLDKFQSSLLNSLSAPDNIIQPNAINIDDTQKLFMQQWSHFISCYSINETFDSKHYPNDLLKGKTFQVFLNFDISGELEIDLSRENIMQTNHNDTIIYARLLQSLDELLQQNATKFMTDFQLLIQSYLDQRFALLPVYTLISCLLHGEVYLKHTNLTLANIVQCIAGVDCDVRMWLEQKHDELRQILQNDVSMGSHLFINGQLVCVFDMKQMLRAFLSLKNCGCFDSINGNVLDFEKLYFNNIANHDIQLCSARLSPDERERVKNELPTNGKKYTLLNSHLGWFDSHPLAMKAFLDVWDVLCNLIYTESTYWQHHLNMRVTWDKHTVLLGGKRIGSKMTTLFGVAHTIMLSTYNGGKLNKVTSSSMKAPTYERVTTHMDKRFFMSHWICVWAFVDDKTKSHIINDSAICPVSDFVVSRAEDKQEQDKLTAQIHHVTSTNNIIVDVSGLTLAEIEAKFPYTIIIPSVYKVCKTHESALNHYMTLYLTDRAQITNKVAPASIINIHNNTDWFFVMQALSNLNSWTANVVCVVSQSEWEYGDTLFPDNYVLQQIQTKFDLIVGRCIRAIMSMDNFHQVAKTFLQNMLKKSIIHNSEYEDDTLFGIQYVLNEETCDQFLDCLVDEIMQNKYHKLDQLYQTWFDLFGELDTSDVFECLPPNSPNMNLEYILMKKDWLNVLTRTYLKHQHLVKILKQLKQTDQQITRKKWLESMYRIELDSERSSQRDQILDIVDADHLIPIPDLDDVKCRYFVPTVADDYHQFIDSHKHILDHSVLKPFMFYVLHKAKQYGFTTGFNSIR